MEQIDRIAAFYEGGTTVAYLVAQPVTEILRAARSANKITKERKAEMNKK